MFYFEATVVAKTMAIATAVIPLKLITSRRLQPKNHTPFLAQNRPFKVSCCVLHNPSSLHAHCQKLVDEFDPRIPIEKSVTPPTSWYSDPSFFDYELHRVFYGGWQAVVCCHLNVANHLGSIRFGNVEFLVCRDDDGKVHAFHNVCRHHGSLLASGSGKKSCFVCPYHIWALDGHNLVLLRTGKCQVIFDYFIEAYHKIEDIMLCEGVQSGLESPEYCSGRCAPTVEKAMHHFHQLLHDNLKM
ncbi:hypothetical protein GH714_017591 [Hevea brasiliensis]|uniref:Choline monooxygenase, chloroplastic n=1 Tax=Hevea brasiliensis TaxID=3981 RepID=A0A6A6MZG1_HEVBR|nr:hypothetical protein GH714_017591 [Hevea brasiliensis]